jgi:hypothetical protein
MPIIEFMCPTHNRFERICLGHTPLFDLCPTCGEVSQRVPSTFFMRGFPKIPSNHLPESMGGAIKPHQSYWK